MNYMSYNDFLVEVKKTILDFLPEKFWAADVSISQVVKNNDCVLDALIIKTTESNVIPTIYLNPYYEELSEGVDLDSIMSAIASSYETHYKDHNINVEWISDYEEVKYNIVIKLINYENNSQFLQDKPYTRYEDLACIYQIDILNDSTTHSAVTLTDRLLEGYGITIDELHAQALKNMESLPYRFRGMNEVIKEMLSSSNMLDDAEDIAAQIDEEPNIMYVLTNEININGAAVIISEKVRHEIAHEVGDFYVLPSSIHEVLIVPKSSGMEPRELQKMVCEVNQSQVDPPERLSNNVYEYNSKDARLSIVTSGIRQEMSSIRSTAGKLEDGIELDASDPKMHL